MNEEHTKYLINKYPRLYKGKNKLYCDRGHIGGRDGWFKIVDGLSNSLTELEKTIRLRYPKFYIRAAQVKEKFGSLCFYVDFDGYSKKNNSENWIAASVYGVISRYENDSDHTCEVCGRFGRKSENLHWIQTLCYSHYMPLLKEQIMANIQYGDPIGSWRLFKSYLNKRLNRSYNAKGMARIRIILSQYKWFIKALKSDWATSKYRMSLFRQFINYFSAPYNGLFVRICYSIRNVKNRWL